MKTTKAVDYGNCEEKVINGTQERRDEREMLSGRGGESHWAGDGAVGLEVRVCTRGLGQI